MISVIIYSHKNKSYLEQSLVTLSQQDCDWEAIVIDDGFSVSKPRIPRDVSKNIRVIDTHKPVGFLRAVAIGMSLVRGDRCVIQRGCDCHIANRLDVQSKILDSVHADVVFDVPRVLVDSGSSKLDFFEQDKVPFRSVEEHFKLVYQEKFIECFGCITGFMFKVNAFNIGQLHRRMLEEKGKPSSTFATNTIQECLPRFLYQSSRALSIVNYKSDVELFENNDFQRICSYNK